MIKRRRPQPDLTFQPRVLGKLHIVKERTGKVVQTRCGVIVDTSARQPVRTTIWNDYDCRDCLNPRSV